MIFNRLFPNYNNLNTEVTSEFNSSQPKRTKPEEDILKELLDSYSDWGTDAIKTPVKIINTDIFNIEEELYNFINEGTMGPAFKLLREAIETTKATSVVNEVYFLL